MIGNFLDVVMVTKEQCQQLAETVTSLCKGDIIYADTAHVNRQTTVLTGRCMSVSFTGIVNSSEMDSIQDMQYGRFILTMAEMMQKYALEN